MKLSIVIVNYNVKYFLEQCLLSVNKALQNIEAEVWVVDNDSVDGSIEMVQAKFPWVKCIANKENVGFSKANNQAIRQCSGTYVLLLNPDTVVREDTFEKCLSYLDAHPNVGGLGVKMIDGKGKFLPESKRGLPTPEVAFYKMAGLNKLFPKSKRFGKYHMGFIGEEVESPVDVLSGAFMLMRKSVLDEIGLLDETFFMYGEDIDLSYRITQAGYQNVYFPQTSIIHYKGESTKRMSANYVFIFYRAMVIFAKKHYQGNSARLFVGLINSAIYLRAGLAIAQRALLRSYMYILDALLILAGLVGIKEYWEEHIKNFEGYFAPVYAQTHFPIYTFIWIIMVFWSGGYVRPYSMNRVIRGVLAGSLVISALFAFLPDNLQYSRGIILAGTALSAAVMIFVRLLVHYLTYKNLDIGRESDLNTVIVGKDQERSRVLKLLQNSGGTHQFVGFLSLEPEDNPEVLGQLDRLKELILLYDLNEIIFCAKDVSSQEIMTWMNRLSQTAVNFKIVPDDSGFIIGSNAKDVNGEFYTEEIRFRIGRRHERQKKRLIDAGLCLALIPLGLLLSWWKVGFVRYYKRVFEVLFGGKTWVSYAEVDSTEQLPKLKPGIFTPNQRKFDREISSKIRERLNYFYAKNYRVDMDITTVLRNAFSN